MAQHLRQLLGGASGPQVKAVGQLKACAAKGVIQLVERREPLVLTETGGARAVLRDVASYE